MQMMKLVGNHLSKSVNVSQHQPTPLYGGLIFVFLLLPLSIDDIRVLL